MWKHYGNGKTLQLLLVRRKTQLVGFAPLFSTGISKTKIKEFRFLGHRKGNYLGFYAQAGMDRAVFDRIIDYLNKLGSPIILSLTDVNSSSSFYKMLEAHDVLKKRGYHKYGLYPCPYGELDDDWETFFKKAISQGKKRTELRKFERKLSTLGLLEFETVKVFVDYVPTFNPVFSKFSVGHVHLVKLMRSLIDKGIAVFDFSKGEEAYKRKWSTHETWNYLLLFHLNANILSSVFYVMKRIRKKIVLWIRKSGYGKQIKQFIARVRNLPHTRKRNEKFTIDIIKRKEGREGGYEFSYECFQHLPDLVQQFLDEYRYNHSEYNLKLCCDSANHATIIDQSATNSRAEIEYKGSYLCRECPCFSESCWGFF